jgi:ATP-dependent helicase/nuclease subunit B
MTLQFILGTASFDHEKMIMDDLQSQMNHHPHDQFFYLVPNHIKFESEVEALKKLNQRNDPLYAESNFQTFSIPRLVWYYMKNHPAYQRTRLSDAGISMLIYQILLDHQDELTVFRGEKSQTGFIQKLAQQIAEMQAGKITADDLKRMFNQPDLTPGLQDKLHDFIIIYRAFETCTAGEYLYKSDVLNLFAQYLESHQIDLSHSHFAFNGFNQFTAQESHLVSLLIQQAASVTISLNLDRPYVQNGPTQPTLFYQAANWYHQFYQVARNAGVAIFQDQFAKRQRVSDELRSLDAYWQQSEQLGKIDPPKITNPANIQVFHAATPFAELESIATQIRQMVTQNGYRYADFLILTRHLDRYQNIIKPVFNMLQVPYFSDITQSMENHPLVELITALFQLESGTYHYQYADVMRLLKTELMLPRDSEGEPLDIAEYRKDVALTENLVLKNGYAGQRWLQDEDWQYVWLSDGDFGVQSDHVQDLTRRINVIRHFVKDTFPPFFNQMRQAKTGRQAVQILYEFLIQTGVVEQLKHWRQTSIDHDDLVEAAQPEQVWQTLCNLLDDYVSILGETQFNLEDFLALLQTGFQGATYAQIPSTLDQVAISESGIVQMHNRKVVFMLGSTDDVMPDKITTEALFSDADRDDLSAYFTEGQYLRETAESQMANDPFLNYLAFLAGSEKLVFTYNLGGDDDTNRQISPYVQRIVNDFGLTIQHIHDVPQFNDNVMNYVGTYRSTLRHLVQVSQAAQVTDTSLTPNWQFIYQQLVHQPDYQALTHKLLGGLDYNNTPTRLTQNIVTGLYGTTLNTSISKLEQFYRNPYEYFLRYGLKLKERDVFELSPASTGQFYHEALDYLMRTLHAKHLELSTLPHDQLKQLVNTVVAEILANQTDMQYAILDSSHRMNYLKQQLIQTVQHTALTLQKQSQYTPMRPHQTEVSFGQVGNKHDLKPLSFILSANDDLQTTKLINVRGRIDRIDAMRINDKDYLGIVDYKSSDKNLDFAQVYDGTSMQMMTYLDVLSHNLDQLDPNAQAALAGAVYLHICNPKYTVKEAKGSMEDMILNKQKYKGILINDTDLLDQIDQQLTGNQYGYSKLFSIYKKKDGTFNTDAIVKSDDLQRLMAHNEMLIKQAGQEIFTGNIDLTPARFSTNQDAMQYTPYRSIMQFDPLLNENNYRDVPSYDLATVLKKIREEHK